MAINGLRKFSLIDYPGKISCVVFFSSLTIGYLPIYLLYCLCVRSRVCTECHHRIYPPEGKK